MIRAGAARVAVGFVAIAGVVSLLAGCASGPGLAGDPSVSGSAALKASETLDAAVGSVPQRSVAATPTARLAKGVIPPTNHWFSGLVFGAAPQPVYPLPLSFNLTGTGFAFGTPKVVGAANTVIGAFNPAVTIDAAAKSFEVTRYDDASVTLAALAADGSKLGTVTIAEGSPVVTFTAARAGTVQLSGSFTSVRSHLYSTSAGGSNYGLKTSGSVSGATLHLTSGQTAEWFAVPDGSSVAGLASHVSALHSVSLAYSVARSKVSTTLTYHSAGDSLVAALPQQKTRLTSGACALGGYPSVYGTLSLCAGPKLGWTAPRVAASNTLDASKLTVADKSELRSQLGKDVAATPVLPTDSYYGGKALYRLANLLTVAHEIGDTARATSIQKTLDAALVKWTTPNGCASRAGECFVYDAAVKGVVGLDASFGSDQFNDHHFHYGYFLYAASVASKYDPSLVSTIKPVINLLAADIASPAATKDFPARRVFDAYAGHSWASGYSPFADGNNQESSSEAVDAWNGLALWSSVTKNGELTTEADWMLSAEAATARADWTNASVGNGYQHGVVGINWGDKRDYATWFSADPSAKLGIQLIPMSPASGYLAGDPARIRKNLAEAAPNGYDVSLGDYLLMYSALEGSAAATKALTTARTLPDKYIDDADSRTYLLAWIMTR